MLLFVKRTLTEICVKYAHVAICRLLLLSPDYFIRNFLPPDGALRASVRDRAVQIHRALRRGRRRLLPPSLPPSLLLRASWRHTCCWFAACGGRGGHRGRAMAVVVAGGGGRASEWPRPRRHRRRRRWRWLRQNPQSRLWTRRGNKCRSSDCRSVGHE